MDFRPWSGTTRWPFSIIWLSPNLRAFHLGHTAGFESDWTASRARRLGEKSYDDIAALWATLKEGGSKEIVSSVRAPFRNEDDGRVLNLAFESVIEPLVMLGRGRVV